MEDPIISGRNVLLNDSLVLDPPPHGGALNNQLLNRNFLSPLNFAFSIKKAPHVNFFIQKVNVPGMLLGGNTPEPHMATPFVNIPEPGDHITYEPLHIVFRIDEDLQNYLEIHNWIKGLGFPKNFREYAELAQVPQFTGKGLRSDITTIVMTNEKMPNLAVTYVDAYPFYLSQIMFDTTKEDVEYLTAEARFAYTYYDILNA
jgi:hypothetical protein